MITAAKPQPQQLLRQSRWYCGYCYGKAADIVAIAAAEPQILVNAAAEPQILWYHDTTITAA